jgi:NAD(P)-dependent dehydrogenase (short-subunit alcohol dehydrogenase family)
VNSLGVSFSALVIGSSGSIGAALVQALREDPACVAVSALSRRTDPAFSLEDEASMARCAAVLQPQPRFQLIIDATGALTIDGQGPEKQLGALNAAALLRSFQINSVGPALLLKHFTPLLEPGRRAIYAKLSARVGSIADNRKGGWYGYRASKAALNMLLQTAAVEVHRKQPLWVVAALQPGTVRSPLSRPFVADADALTPALSVAGMLRALDGLPAQSGAHFIDYRGDSIPW